jgi:hypothetical protein
MSIRFWIAFGCRNRLIRWCGEVSGLLIRELELRGLAERILIVCPANLAFQWQRELKEKFDTEFLVLKGQDIRDQFGVNQWLDETIRNPSGIAASPLGPRDRRRSAPNVRLGRVTQKPATSCPS